MLRFNEGVSTFLELTFVAEKDTLLKEDLVRFCVNFRVTYLIIRDTLEIDFTAWVRLVTSIVNDLLLRFSFDIWRDYAAELYFLRLILMLRLFFSNLYLSFREFDDLEESSPALNEIDARDRFNCSLSRVSFEEDWTVCYRCRLLSVDLKMSLDWEFQICVALWVCWRNRWDARL